MYGAKKLMKSPSTRKVKKPFIIAICSVCSACLLGIFFLPAILSTEWVSSAVKRNINNKAPGTIDFKNVSFSWTNGFHAQDIVYENKAEGITFRARDISTEKGLLALATNYTNIGQVTITDPTTYIHLQKNNSSSTADIGAVQKEMTTDKAEPFRQKDAEETKDKSAPLANESIVPQIDGTLTISGGTVIVVSEDFTEKTVLTALQLQATIASQTNTLEYQIHFQDADGAGKVDGGGTISLPATNDTTFDHLQAKATLSIETWETRELLSILARNGNTPTGKGILTAQFDIEGSFDSAFRIKGTIAGSDIHVEGGGLKSDTPYFDKMAIEVDVTKKPSTIKIDTLRLQSPIITGEIFGGVGADDKTEITGKANLDLAEIFKQFPDTLNLQDGISVSDGNIAVKAILNGTKDFALFNGRAQLKHLQGRAANKTISWNQPVTIELKGEQGKGGLRLDHFTARSSFLDAQGHGTSDDIQFNMRADLGAALKEIQKFIQLDDWNTSGIMKVDLQVSKTSETTYPIDSKVNVEDFVLRYKDRLIAPKSMVAMNFNNIVQVDKNMRPLDITGTALDFQTWIGSGSATIEHIGLPTDTSGLSVNNIGLQGSFDLAPLASMLQSLDTLPKKTVFGGNSTLVAKLSLSEEKLDLDQLRVETRDFLYQTDKHRLDERKIQLRAGGSVDLKRRSALIQSASLTTAAGHVAIPELVITNWSQLDTAIRTNASAEVNLSELSKSLNDFIAIPDDVSVAGTATLKLELDLTKAEAQSALVIASIKPLAIGSKNSLLAEDSIDLRIDLTGNSATQNYNLKSLNLTASPFSLNATGELISSDHNERLTTEGFIDFNLEAVSRQILSLLDIGLEMKGVSKNQFVLKAQSTHGNWAGLQSLSELSTSFSADSITGHGLSIESLEIAVNINNGQGRITIQGRVNQGEMSIQPTINSTEETAILSLPDNAILLKEVELTRNMSEDIMAKVHPLFKGAAVTSGSIDLSMQSFHWPLSKAAQKDAAFTGDFTFHDVKLQASGLLLPLLALMSVDEQEITLSNEPMTFVGENQRIICSPLEIMTKNYSLSLNGSIGFDQSLDYLAKIPVTRKMVGSNAFRYLEGTFITVPLQGTVSKPTVNKNVVQEAIADLVKQAGKKEITNQAGKLLQKLFQ